MIKLIKNLVLKFQLTKKSLKNLENLLIKLKFSVHLINIKKVK